MFGIFKEAANKRASGKGLGLAVISRHSKWLNSTSDHRYRSLEEASQCGSSRFEIMLAGLLLILLNSRVDEAQLPGSVAMVILPAPRRALVNPLPAAGNTTQKAGGFGHRPRRAALFEPIVQQPAKTDLATSSYKYSSPYRKVQLHLLNEAASPLKGSPQQPGRRDKRKLVLQRRLLPSILPGLRCSGSGGLCEAAIDPFAVICLDLCDICGL